MKMQHPKGTQLSGIPAQESYQSWKEDEVLDTTPRKTLLYSSKDFSLSTFNLHNKATLSTIHSPLPITCVATTPSSSNHRPCPVAPDATSFNLLTCVSLYMQSNMFLCLLICSLTHLLLFSPQLNLKSRALPSIQPLSL